MSTGISCHFGHLLQVSKKSLRSLILYHFFMILYVYIAPGQRQTAHRGQRFDVNSYVLSLHSIVASLKKVSLWSLILYNFFHDLIHVYSPGAEAYGSQRTKFECQQRSLICCKFQRNLSEVWFYTSLFHDLIHVYSSGAGDIQSPGDKSLMSTETSCHFGHLLLVSNHRRQ